MRNLSNYVKAFWTDESGISSVEYALLLAFIAAGVATAAGLLGGAVDTAITDACTNISGAAC